MTRRRRILPWALSLGLVMVIVLALYGPEPRGEAGDADDAARYKAAVQALANALTSGQAAEQTLSEVEINGRIADLLARRVDTGESSWLTLELDDAQVDLGDGAMTVFIRGRLAGAPLVFRVGFAECGPYGPLPRRTIWLGRLPLVGPFGQLVAQRMKPLLAPLRKERTVVSQLETCKIEDDRIHLTVAAAQ